MRRGFGFLWLALTLVIVAVVGVISYQAGLATHLPAEAAAVAPNYYYEPHFFGFGLFGALFFLFLLFLLFRVARFAAWGGRGWGGGGGWKHGGYGGGVPPAIEERMQEWHKHAHGEQTAPVPPPPDQKQA
jgi:hypothetical protein